MYSKLNGKKITCEGGMTGFKQQEASHLLSAELRNQTKAQGKTERSRHQSSRQDLHRPPKTKCIVKVMAECQENKQPPRNMGENYKRACNRTRDTSRIRIKSDYLQFEATAPQRCSSLKTPVLQAHSVTAE